MKKIILNTRQFIRLNEGMNDVPTIDVVSDSLNDVASIGKEAAEKVAASGAKQAKVRVMTKNANPSGALEIKGEGDSVEDQLRNAADSTISSGMDDDMTAFTTILGSDGQPVRENRIFKKKKINEAIIKTLNENSTRYSKSELIELLKK